ncbi:putative endonuclease 4-like protein [Leptotrombidium deliense]|uniref:Putative endonuclease 4-like protein n=1 Tax=Leptotrombidium deliense TaxID=299467 RepID=A0A443SBE2_9ACAR|nr:putative endonuclease 4-like protein [Leptotrombidium deliense]
MPPKKSAKRQRTQSPNSETKELNVSSARDKDWFQTSENKVFIGAHVSISGGLYKSILEATSINGQAFGLFLCNQRRWDVKPLDKSDAEQFRKVCEAHGYPSHLMVPHASYLVNCGSPKEDNLAKSRNLMLDGVKRCEALGIDLYNFHPGSTCGDISRKECIERIADSINFVHKNSNKVITVIENMSKQGHTIGGDFSEIRDIIKHVDDKSRVGVCLDTCHAFAAGYDISKESGFKKMIQEFETEIGFQYLKAIHLNDSKGKVGCHLDRHENIGKGYIGLDGFKLIVNEPKFKGIPMILETPVTADNEEYIYREEIKLLYSLINKC